MEGKKEKRWKARGKSTVTKEDTVSKYKTEQQTEPCTPIREGKPGISQMQNSGANPEFPSGNFGSNSGQPQGAPQEHCAWWRSCGETQRMHKNTWQWPWPPWLCCSCQVCISARSRNTLEVKPQNTCLFLEAGEHLPPRRLCKVSERWVTARAYSVCLLVSQPLAPTKEGAAPSYSTCDTPSLFPSTLKPLHSAVALGRKKQTDKIPLKENLNLKILLHGEKMQLSHSWQVLGGKGLQADRSSWLSLFWIWKTADRWVSWEFKDWLYRRSKNMGKTGESLILQRWGNPKSGSILCTMLCYHMRKPRNGNTPPTAEFTSFPTLPTAPEWPQHKGGSAQKDLSCHPSVCCPKMSWLCSAPPGYFSA